MTKWVKCTITFYYDEEAYTSWDEDVSGSMTEEMALERCKEMMVEDVTRDYENPITTDVVRAEFAEPPWIKKDREKGVEIPL
jgi:hypothetical protein